MSAVSETSRRDFDIDGFKTIKFGMTREEAVGIGLKCVNVDWTLLGIDPFKCTGNSTLFGQRALVYVSFHEGALNFISVDGLSEKPLDYASAYTKIYGPPRIAVMPSIGGTPLRSKYWISRTGSSTRIERPVAEEGKPNTTDLFGQKRYTDHVIFPRLRFHC